MRNINYIKEMNSFRKYAYENYMSKDAVLLWYALFGVDNDLYFKDWFKIDNLRLMGYAFIKREATLIKARQELIDMGLIKFKKGSKGHPSEYYIVMFSEQQQNNTYPNCENEAEDVADNNIKPDTEQNNTEQPEMNNDVQPAVSNDNSTAAINERPKANYFYYYKPKKDTNNYKQYNPRDRSKSTNRNRFNNFEQRDIDINELERMLLANNLASLV
jgi:hypothetical protein